MHYNHVAVVTLLALLVHIWMAGRVGAARGKFKIEAPATTGDPEFERHFRIHANTTEGLVAFLPSLWLFAVYVDERFAAGLGLIWVLGRLLYMFGYLNDPKQRSRGFGIQALAMLVLLIGALIGVGAVLIASGGA